MVNDPNFGPLKCAVCGASLGMGLPGDAYCSQCGQYVFARAAQGDAGAIIGAMVALGLGLLVAYLISRS